LNENRFVGIVGNDLFGRSVTNRMSSDGVNLDYLETIDGLQTVSHS
jgi:sugar/nucleoside kinase (ribokinase family)